MPRLSDITGATLPPGRDVEIAGVTADSREVRPGWLFAALPGSRRDGRDFIPEAIARGAVAVLAPPGTEVPGETVLVADDNPRRALALAAARLHPRQPEVIAAVTGTNGKTSVASFTRQVWARLGRSAASLGTLGVVSPAGTEEGSMTTPDPVALHQRLQALAEAGVTHAAIEASSHGLDQHRLDGVGLAAGAFTNVTRDHLDYHGDMEAYAAAKLRLFRALLPSGAVAVVNADDAFAIPVTAAARERGLRVISYGRAGGDIALLDIRPEADAQILRLRLDGREHGLRLPLAGGFQAMNALCALGLVIACGDEAGAALAALEHLEGVPGRLQQAGTRACGAPVFVDYAHTPDALAAVLRALRPHAAGRLVVVFGAGGDRDPGKRPQMGAVARELADEAIVTDDNPRGEDAAAIRRAVLEGCPDAREIGDRAEAIRTAVRELAPGDVLVVAGKGHERGQIVGDTVLPFDDIAQVRAALAELGEAA